MTLRQQVISTSVTDQLARRLVYSFRDMFPLPFPNDNRVPKWVVDFNCTPEHEFEFGARAWEVKLQLHRPRWYNYRWLSSYFPFGCDSLSCGFFFLSLDTRALKRCKTLFITVILTMTTAMTKKSIRRLSDEDFYAINQRFFVLFAV